MLNWVDILRRILSLYKVRTQAELGMALGLPVQIGLDGARGSAVIPWEILEKVVAEKRVSWDWLLTGGEPASGAQPEEEHGQSAAPLAEGGASLDPGAMTGIRAAAHGGQPDASEGGDVGAAGVPLPAESRELERVLLAKEKPGDAPPPEELPEQPMAARPSDSVVRELKDLKSTMRKNIERVEQLLGEEPDTDLQ